MRSITLLALIATLGGCHEYEKTNAFDPPHAGRPMTREEAIGVLAGVEAVARFNQMSGSSSRQFYCDSMTWDRIAGLRPVDSALQGYAYTAAGRPCGAIDRYANTTKLRCISMPPEGLPAASFGLPARQ